jgi:putative beta-lysine N-acetyltransferase
MRDIIETWRNSTVQHGDLSRRIYLMKLHRGDYPDILQAMEDLAGERGYEKIVAKVPAGLGSFFRRRGYRTEARVPGFFRGIEDAVFLAKYPTPERSLERHREEIGKILAWTGERANTPMVPGGDPPLGVEACRPSDAEEMGRVYKEVFQTYPFPIHDPGYLADAMKGHVRYYCLRKAGKMVALAAAEMDVEGLNVEMTDFATLSQWRSLGLAGLLLDHMDKEMASRGLFIAYTIARALSRGMNRTFGRTGYLYAGTLTNNTNISGRIESMNVWYRDLRKEGFRRGRLSVRSPGDLV